MDSQTNQLAIASAVLGVLGLIQAIPLFGAIGAVISGHMARGQLAMNPGQEGGGLAILGLITGYVTLLSYCAGLAIIILWFGGFAALFAFMGLAGAAGGM